MLIVIIKKGNNNKTIKNIKKTVRVKLIYIRPINYKEIYKYCLLFYNKNQKMGLNIIFKIN